MNLTNTFDLTLMGHEQYRSQIEKVYPGQYVNLEVVHKETGFYDVIVSTENGVIGELFGQEGAEVAPFLNDENNYVEAFVKKLYVKELIYQGVVLIINVYEKPAGFTPPEHPRLGDYVPEMDKYHFGAMMNEDDEIKCSLLNYSSYSNVVDYDPGKFIINGNIIDVCSVHGKEGNLSPKVSARIIPYLQSPDHKVDVNFRVRENEDFEMKIRLEVTISEKKQLLSEMKKVAPETKKKSLKVEWLAPSPHNQPNIQKPNGCLRTVAIVLAVIFGGFLLMMIIAMILS